MIKQEANLLAVVVTPVLHGATSSGHILFGFAVPQVQG